MYCPSCGKQTPENSTFCLHCGTRIASPRVVPTPARQIPIEWEYQDFVYRWSPGQIWVNVGRQGYTMPAARAWFWQEYQRQIMSDLQKWLDEGWEPISEVGPSSIEVRTFQSIKTSAFGWLVVITLSIFMLGLPLLLMRDAYAEPTEFRLQMRRPKR
jgi:hypothetical protein